MKRIFLALALVASVQVANAQIKSDADIQKAIEKAEATALDAKKGAKPAPWVKLAEAYAWKAERVEKSEDLDAAFRRMIDTPGPYLVDVHIPRDESVFPMVAPGKALSQVIGAIENGEEGLRIVTESEQIGGAR